MATAALDFTYRYAFPSGIAETEQGSSLRLATCGANHEQPHFFHGKMLAPRETGQMLLTLSDVVRTHFFLQRPALLDPVVTSNEAMLRLEGFSGCCGVYARVDLPVEAFEGTQFGRGTTNVDFNNPMRAALTRLREHDDVRFAVGDDGVALTKGEVEIVEKKVKLPIRWVKGFSEVQLYQPTLQVMLEVEGSEARKFLRSFPKGGAPKRPSFVTKTGRSIRLSQRSSKGAVEFHGTHRVRVIEPLLMTAKTLRIWSDVDSGVTAWEVLLKAGRFFLMLSPEVYRGFSGEGQALEKLAGNRWEKSLPWVQEQLNWESRIDIDSLKRNSSFSIDEIEAALAVLGSRGLAGYDAGQKAYFHRQLPFDLEKVEQLQPRLKAARKLLETGGLSILTRDEHADAPSGTHLDVEVPGTGVQHVVRLRPDGDKCTCPWFSKYQGKRGPCKHILAAQMFTTED